MAHDVFICYSTLDKTVADAVCATLEGRKIRCWIAPRDVPPGRPWAGALMDAIGQSRVFVLVFSDGANRSEQVLREVTEAINQRIPIIPFRIEAVDPAQDLGYYLKPIHWLDAVTPPLEKHLDELASRVQTWLTSRKETEPSRAAIPPLQTDSTEPDIIRATKETSYRNWLPWLLAGLMALILVTLVVASLTTGGRLWTVAQREPTTEFLPGPTFTENSGARIAPISSPTPSRAGAAPTRDVLPSGQTPPPVRILAELSVPSGIAPAGGLGWDGSQLWIARDGGNSPPAVFITMDKTGNTTGAYQWQTRGALDFFGGFTWAGEELWLLDWGSAIVLKRDGTTLTEIGRREKLSNLATRATYVLTWDGKSFWSVQGAAVYRFDSSGATLEHFIYHEEVNGLAWDGTVLWVSAGGKLEVFDEYRHPLGRFPVVGADGTMKAVGRLTWDGQHLWTLVRGEQDFIASIYKLDAGGARQYAAAQMVARDVPRLVDLLSYNFDQAPPGQVEVRNETGRALRLLFPGYRYSVVIDAGISKVITPPESQFTAEVDGLTGLAGEWPFELDEHSYIWTFKIVE